MAFLTTSDLSIDPAIQAKITSIDADAFNDAFAISEAYLNDRLIHMYDMNAELAKTGTDRRLTLVNIGIKIATYEAYKRAPQINIPVLIKSDYDEAEKQLNKIENGGLLTNLEKQTDETQQLGNIRYGSSSNNQILY